MSNGKKGNKKFSKQDLTKADMHGQNLRFADFRGAILVEANLSEADLTEADLREADLKGADLRKANMQGAFIRDANLRGADLSSAINLAAIDVDSSYIDKDTRFPPNVQVKWKTDREYTCKEFVQREKNGRREGDRRMQNKGRIWGDRRKKADRRTEEDRRGLAKKTSDKNKDTRKKVKKLHPKKSRFFPYPGKFLFPSFNI